MTIATAADLIDVLDASPVLSTAQRAELPKLRSRFAEPRGLARELIGRGWLTSYQVNQLFRGRSHELILGPYVVLERLGEGGVGQVFKARHQRMDRIVALKVVRPELLADPETVDRFQREIQVVSQLTHPNVVHAFDAGPIGSNYFLAMELVEGIDLLKLVEQRGKLPFIEACDYLRQAALGLQHIHERGLVHRDIKPHNLLLAQAHGSIPATIKILDLGLARLQRPVDRDARKGVTAAGTILGTVDYMAPEQALDFRQVDSRADIYSLGCTFYHLLTGKPPFPDGTAAQKLLKHQQAEPPPLAIQPETATLIRRMLAKRPEERVQTAAEVVAVLSGKRTPVAAIAGSVDARVQVTEWQIQPSPNPPPGGEVPRPQGAGLGIVAPVAMLVTDTTRQPVAAAIPLTAPGRRLTSLLQTPLRRRGFRWLAAAGAVAALALFVVLAWPQGRRPDLPLEKLPSPAETTDADLQRLKKRHKDYTAADPEALRRYLLGVERLYAGDPRGPQAVDLFMQLPSPLDRLEPGTVSSDDRALVGPLDGWVGSFGDSRLRHWGPVKSVTFSPDNAMVASGGDDQVARLWDASSGKQLRVFPHGGNVNAVRFMDGNRLASASDSYRWWDLGSGKEVPAPPGRPWGITRDGKLAATQVGNLIKIWQTSNGHEKLSFAGHAKNIWMLAFSADGQLAASTAEDLTILVWETGTGKIRATLRGHAKPGTKLVFAGNDKLAVGEHETRVIKIWELATEKEYMSLPVTHMWDIAPDGKTLVAQGNDALYRVWDLPGRKERGVIKHEGWAAGVLFSPDGQTLVTSTHDGTTPHRFWDVATLTERPSRTTGAGHAVVLTFAPDSKTLATAGKEGTLKLWDVAAGAERLPGPSRAEWFTAAAFSHDAQTLALAAFNKVKLYDTATAKERATAAAHGNLISAIAFSPDDQVLASASHDGTLKLWNVASGGLLWTLAHGHAVIALAFAPDGKTVYSAGETTVKAWDPSTGALRATLQRVPQHGVSALAVAANDKLLAVGHHDSTVSLWDPAAATMRGTFPVSKGAVLRVACSADGHTVVARCHEDQAIKVWDVEAKKERFPLQPQASGWGLAPDGRSMTIHYHNGRLQVLDAATGKIKVPLEEQTRPVLGVVYAPDGKRVVTSGTDGQVILWDPDDPRRKVRDWRLPGAVPQVVYAPDGRHIATVNSNGTVFLLRLAGPP